LAPRICSPRLISKSSSVKMDVKSGRWRRRVTCSRGSSGAEDGRQLASGCNAAGVGASTLHAMGDARPVGRPKRVTATTGQWESAR
jgi:hypothetical protein